ncbi:MAG: RNA polymerase sigma-54 factor [Fimbriimonadaceae bacterium]|nr:RNA polymerase sigma-54 factor [Fimbriimonadaceae bacterium]
MANFNQRTELKTATSLRLDPRVVLASQLLELTHQELESAIDTELAENPALQRLEEEEAVTEEAILRSIAPDELRPGTDDFEFARSLPGALEETDWLDLAASETSLWDHLRGQLLPQVDSSLEHVVEYLVSSINERGYLTVAAEEVANDCQCDFDEAERLIGLLKSCEPAGVGASTLQECLLLQLRDTQSVEGKVAHRIVERSFDDFVAGRVRPIMRRLKVMPDLVEAAFREIAALTPFPGEAFRSSSHVRSLRQAAATYDLAINYSEIGWTVEVPGAERGSFAINRHYSRLYANYKAGRRGCRDEKRHITEQVDRANRFLDALDQRKLTLRRIGAYLADHQVGFLSNGRVEFLRPMTRTQMARDLGVHESTVSRATQGKFVRLPNGEVVAFELFFKPALRIQKMIEEILANENPSQPMSDEQISQILGERGVQVARRTVNKYRDRYRLLSSRRRRSA